MDLDHHLLEKLKKDGTDSRLQAAGMLIGSAPFNNMVYDLLSKRFGLFWEASDILRNVKSCKEHPQFFPEYQDLNDEQLLVIICQAKSAVFVHLASVSGAYHDAVFRQRAWDEFFFKSHVIDPEKYLAYISAIGKEKEDAEDA